MKIINLINIIEQVSDIDQKIDKVKLKNPKTGRQNKLMTAVNNKQNPNHSKALDMLKKLRLQVKKADGGESENTQYLDKISNVLKIVKKDEQKIKQKLDRTKTESEFKKTFIESIDPDRVIFDDKVLDLTYKAWKKNKSVSKKEKYDSDDFSDYKFSKTKKPKIKKSNDSDDDFDFDVDTDEKVDPDIKDLNKKNLISLIALASLFGGIKKLFRFSSMASIKYLEKFKDNFSEKTNKLKSIFDDD